MLLLGALSIAAFFAACITGWVVAAYAVYRFAIILTHSQNLPQGLKVRLNNSSYCLCYEVNWSVRFVCTGVQGRSSHFGIRKRIQRNRGIEWRIKSEG